MTVLECPNTRRAAIHLSVARRQHAKQTCARILITTRCDGGSKMQKGTPSSARKSVVRFVQNGATYPCTLQKVNCRPLKSHR